MMLDLYGFAARHTGDRAFLLLDEDGCITAALCSGGALGGLDAGELIGRPLSSFYPAAEQQAGLPAAHLAQAGAVGILRVEGTRIGADTRPFPGEQVIERLIGEDGQARGYACLLSDLQQQRRSAAALTELAREREEHDRTRSERQHLQEAVDGTSQALLLLDRSWTVLHANERAELLLRIARRDLVGRDLRKKLGDAGTAALYEAIERALREHVPATFDEFHALTGTWFEIEASPTPGGAVVVFRDVTERRQSEEQLRRLALSDPVTALPNAALFHDRLAQAVAHAHRSHQRLGLLLIDFTGLARLNDELGADAGDLLTRGLADALQQQVRRSDTLGRLSMDRFAVIQNALSRTDGAATFAEKLLAALAAHARTEELAARIRAVMGIAVLGVDGDSADALLHAAEQALGEADAAVGYRYADADLHAKTRARKQLEKELSAALDRAEFRIFFQPETSVASGRMLGFEALLRWEHPVRGLLDAGTFLPVAAGTDLIAPLGAWAQQETCAQARAWLDAGVPRVRMSLNVTDRDLVTGGLARRLSLMLEQFRLQPEVLELELTEQQLFTHRPAAERLLHELHGVGIGVSIDDFGSSYTPVGDLCMLPIRKIKIGPALTARLDDLPANGRDRAVDTILHLAQSLGLTVVAKGVETEQQLAYLRARGCDAAQGYHIGRPVSAARLSAALLPAREKRARAARGGSGA